MIPSQPTLDPTPMIGSAVVDLPALDGRRPLGFLAALGVLRLLAAHTPRRPRLSWHPGGLHARLHLAQPAGIDDVVVDLQAIAAGLDEAHGYLPGTGISLPLRRIPGAPRNDGMELTPAALTAHYGRWRDTVEPGDLLDDWIAALITDHGTSDRRRQGPAPVELVQRTPYVAPTAQQTLHTILEKATTPSRPPASALREALLGWRRHLDYTGEYLDDHVLHGPVDSARGGGGEERGVPGATWLALMALPLLPTFGPVQRDADSGRRAAAVGWQHDDNKPVMRWPIWRPPLDLHAIRALLVHPALRLRPSAGTWAVANPAAAQALDLLAVCAADRLVIRTSGSNSKRVLRPVPVLQV